MHLRRMCILLLLNEMLFKYQLSPIGINVSFKACTSLLVFYLDDLSSDETGVLKAPSHYYVAISFSFMSVNICFIYRGTPMLGAYIYSYNCCIFSWIDPLIVM